MSDTEQRGGRRDVLIVAAIASVISILALVHFFRAGELLLYGDAVAHINIARRVFDSRSPGPLQLGTVWLPFPHVAMIPFIVNDWMWRTGVGGAVPSMLAYVFGVVGVFRLVRGRTSRFPAIFASALYGLNPNLLYMQSTAMNEPIMLAEMIWAVVYLDEFARGLFAGSNTAGHVASLAPHQALARCGLVLGAAILTRYDGWVLAASCGVVALVLLWRAWPEMGAETRRKTSRSALAFLVFCAVVPALWLSHNYAISARPLDFLNGPYSAKAIEARTTKPGDPLHPGTHDMKVAAIYFWQSAKLNIAERPFHLYLTLMVLFGTAVAIRRWRRFGILLLLWLPLPFYSYSVAYGSVPIFMPVWWPHSYYNVRYGLELLAAFAVFGALPLGLFEARRRTGKIVAGVAACGILALLYIPVALATPISLREARVNSRTRVALEQRLAQILRSTDANSTILMFTGEYVGALQRSGIPLRRVISEAVHPDWEVALQEPARRADYIVAIRGDEVWYAAQLHPQGLRVLADFQPDGKPRVIVYQSDVRPNP
ncbi:MAG TPA: hypothetical protein VN622_14880 [Clostridia bacterium]|nr:hypothetical protein [Clostridia bacterium]